MVSWAWSTAKLMSRRNPTQREIASFSPLSEWFQPSLAIEILRSLTSVVNSCLTPSGDYNTWIILNVRPPKKCTVLNHDPILTLDPKVIDVEIQHVIQRGQVVRAPYNSAFSPFRYLTHCILGAPMWLLSDSDKWLYTAVQLCPLCCLSSRCKPPYTDMY